MEALQIASWLFLLRNATAKVDQVTIWQFWLKNKKADESHHPGRELQTILIAEIETYETLQGTASAAGTSVADAVAAARAAKKENVARVFWDAVVGLILRRQWNYNRWGPKLSTHLVTYCEPQLRKCCCNRVVVKEEEAGAVAGIRLGLEAVQQ